MSDLAGIDKLARSDAQLPVHVYFDEALLQREIQQLFQQGPRYVGHELMVPNVGDYSTLAWEDEGRMLVRNQHGIELLSNVCRHRQAKMLNGRGNRRNIVCPLHRWTYGLDGELIGAPHFSDTPCLEPVVDAAAKLERPAVRTERRRRPAQAGAALGSERPRLQRLPVRPHRSPPVRLQLEDLHRSLSGGLPRRAVPSRPGRLRQLRRTALGIRRPTTACRRSA